MTGVISHIARVGGMAFVPRKGRPHTTWLSLHVDKAVQEAVAREANKERRSQSSMGEILLIEALRARGVDISEEPTTDDDAD